MTTPQNVERCLAFINCQLQPQTRLSDGHVQRACPAVTISRQAGCGALEVAEKLAARLQPPSLKYSFEFLFRNTLFMFCPFPFPLCAFLAAMISNSIHFLNRTPT